MQSVNRYFLVYLLLSIISGLVIFVSLYTNETISSIVRDKMLAYNNPLCIVSSVCLLLSFARVDIGVNKYINWFSKSSFAIYLLHCNILILPYYKKLMHYLYISLDGPMLLIIMLGCIFLIALCSILLDKVRISLWNKLVK